MLVKDAMTSPAVTVQPGTALKEAIRLLEEHEITAMPVVDARGQIVGVLSEADVIEDVLQEGRSPLVVDVMSRRAVTVSPDDRLHDAADLLVSTGVKCLPVVEGSRVVGVVSRRDIVRILARRDEQIEAEVDELVRVAGHDWLVEVHDGVVTFQGPRTETEQELASVLVRTVPGAHSIQIGYVASI